MQTWGYVAIYSLYIYVSIQTECESGFWGDPCQKCDLPGCICTNARNCFRCLPGYYMGGYLCKQCIANCLKCSNGSTCQTCMEGYTGDLCEMSTNCSINCKCATENSCSDCKSGYFNPLNYCNDKCQLNCETCSGSNICTACKPDFYGTICNMTCSRGCNDGSCNKQNGTCSCKAEFAGVMCDVCLPGTYGDLCDMNCSVGCIGTGHVCNKIDGHCTCLHKFTGGKCDQCVDGRYGYNCESECSAGCDNGCYRSDGTCACKSNFNGDKCSRCVPGRYGNNCDKLCSGGCIGSLCNKENGSCTCLSNLIGPTCDQCQTGFYGPNCSTPCPIGCDSSGCFRLNGTCSCFQNFSGVKCDKCLEGMYGASCDIECSQGCVNNSCDYRNGNCTCSGNYTGPKCNLCVEGKFGLFCQEECSPGCYGAECNQMNGSCTCTRNFTGVRCNECAEGLYGGDCSLQCPQNCKTPACTRTDGVCTSCREGFYGFKCESYCNTNCRRCEHSESCSVCKYGFEGKICEMSPASNVNTAKIVNSITYIGGGVGGAVVVIVIVIILVVYCRRRRRMSRNPQEYMPQQNTQEMNDVPVYATVQRTKHMAAGASNETPSTVTMDSTDGNENYASQHRSRMSHERQCIDINVAKPIDETSLELDEDEASARRRAIIFEECGGVYYNSSSKLETRKIMVSYLQEFVANKNMNYFEEEFEGNKLPYGLTKKYEESQRSVNMSMNRYKGIYPYDASRVKVLGGITDYINASFIDGYKRRNAFIATLGPMSKQLDDFAVFWRMIWQHKVEAIVMLTNLVEEEKDKCEQYWPNVSSSAMYGEIRVACTAEDKYADFIRRTFVLNKSAELRLMYHLHFTAWPDKGVPEDVTSLIEFRQMVLNVPSILGGPTVVHCSAGVGPTGTYIALDHLTREGEAEHSVDVTGCVINMRQNRPNMVQTVEQYEYLHRALIHSLTFGCEQKVMTSNNIKPGS